MTDLATIKALNVRARTIAGEVADAGEHQRNLLFLALIHATVEDFERNAHKDPTLRSVLGLLYEGKLPDGALMHTTIEHIKKQVDLAVVSYFLARKLEESKS